MSSNPWVGDLDDSAAAERAQQYSARFEKLAAQGGDMHGEADLVAELVADGSTILDAGCGTGRVAARLAEHGYRTVGVDLDGGMLGEARRLHPDLRWQQADLADLSAALFERRFDAVVAAGNVMPLLTPGTEDQAILALAAVLEPGGLLIAGFGLDDAHLPPSTPSAAAFRSLSRYDAACAAAGLRLDQRWSTWDRDDFDPDGGYAVSVHRLE